MIDSNITLQTDKQTVYKNRSLITEPRQFQVTLNGRKEEQTNSCFYNSRSGDHTVSVVSGDTDWKEQTDSCFYNNRSGDHTAGVVSGDTKQKEGRTDRQLLF